MYQVDDLSLDWKAAVPFNDIETPNISCGLLPGIYGEFSGALSRAMEVPEAMAVFGMLGTVSAVVSHRFSVNPKSGWKEPINIYVAVGLEPGNLKSPVIKKLIRPIEDWEKERVEQLGPEIKRAISERKTKEKIIEKKRAKVSGQTNHEKLNAAIEEIAKMDAELENPPILPKVFATDTTPEQLATNIHEQGGRFSIISDEGGIMKVIAGLYSGGNANIDVILKGIDGGAVRIRRKDRSFDLNPFLTFCLFCQPSVIRNMGKEAAFDGNGLVERFLYLLPESRLGFRTHNTEPIPEVLQGKYNDHIRELLEKYMAIENGNASRFVLELEPAAFSEWREFQDQIEIQLRPGEKLFPIRGWGGKICGYALRIAGLLHVMEYGNQRLTISLETMNRALELTALLIDHALAAFGLMGVDDGMHKAKVVVDWIVVSGQEQINQRDCLRDLKGTFKKVDELKETFNFLKSRHYIRESIEEETGGRPGINFDVNPAVSSEVK